MTFIHSFVIDFDIGMAYYCLGYEMRWIWWIIIDLSLSLSSMSVSVSELQSSGLWMSYIYAARYVISSVVIKSSPCASRHEETFWISD